MKGKITGLTFNADGTQNITVTTATDLRAVYDELKDKEVEFGLNIYSPKRSRNANAYCWELCEKIAEVMSRDGTVFTKEEVYRQSIKEVGIWRDFTLDPDDAKTLRTAWEMLGVGWVTEQVDFAPDGENVVVRCYYGSSKYSRKQMGRLLDNLIQECETLGIEHRPPDEIEKLKSLWASAPTERK